MDSASELELCDALNIYNFKLIRTIVAPKPNFNFAEAFCGRFYFASRFAKA